MNTSNGQKHENIAEELASDFEHMIGKRDALVSHIQVLNATKMEIETKLARAQHMLARLDEAAPKKEPF